MTALTFSALTGREQFIDGFHLVIVVLLILSGRRSIRFLDLLQLFATLSDLLSPFLVDSIHMFELSIDLLVAEIFIIVEHSFNVAASAS